MLDENINKDIQNIQNTQEITDRKIDAQDFANLVGISYRTLKRYQDSGKLIPRRTLGGKAYFLLCDVETYKNHHTDEPLFLAEVSTNDTK